jgi:hypothetical protein
MDSGTALIFCPPPAATLQRPARSRARRLGRTFLMVLVPNLVFGLISAVVSFIVMARMDAEDYPSMAAFHQAQFQAALLVGLVVGVIADVLMLVAFALLAPKVSYRRRDWLLLFVPFWNMVVFCTVLWRLSDLSARNWPIRVDEIPADWFVPVPASSYHQG